MSAEPRFRRSLRAATAASATPYGYTITTWTSGTLTATTIGAPHVVDVLLASQRPRSRSWRTFTCCPRAADS